MSLSVVRTSNPAFFNLVDGSNPVGTVSGVMVLDGVTGNPTTLPTATRTFVNTAYRCVSAFTGASVGDLIFQSDEYDLTTSPATLVGTVWRNATLSTVISAPAATKIVPISLPTGYSYTNVNASGNTTIAAGTLKSLTINRKGTVASTITVYDGTDNTGPVVAILDSLNLSGTFELGPITLVTGLFIVATGTVGPNYTVAYK
jgi:hypothetical protein